ncbi:LysR family transcriptional regulator [Intestinibacter sp.]|uniref:LysR family transcriptional regulator n=1 Tax=Intestinibacter sp. TaxID=1965304 RepID=UPI003F13EE71
MNTRQLEYFISVAENLSFTKAAEEFYISQTAVTQQIKSLEDQMQVKLFIRNKRHVELTSAGEFFLTEARNILKNINDAIYKTQQLANGFFGTLNIGFLLGYKKDTLTQYIKNFSSFFPNVSLNIVSYEITDLLYLVKNNHMDLAFVINPKNKPLKDFEYKSIGKYNLIALLACYHPLANKKSIDLAELKYDKFIFIKETGNEYGQKSMVQDRYEKSGFIPNIVQRCNDLSTIESMVEANMGVSILPSFCINENSSKNIRAIPIKDTEDEVEVVAIWNKDNTNPALKKFISML